MQKLFFQTIATLILLTAASGNAFCQAVMTISPTPKEEIRFLIIHIFVPLAGLWYFLRLKNRMEEEYVEKPPVIELFIVFMNYGGIVLMVLTSLFWYWSAMASLATFYLYLVAPIPMGIIAYRQWKRRKISKYHKWTYILGLTYLIIVLAMFIASLSFNLIIRKLMT